MHRKRLLTAERNLLIDSLPRTDKARLLARCETVQLELSVELCVAGAPTQYVYFPSEAFISLVAQVDEHPGLEVGMVGREGMVGVEVALGVATSPVRALVQGPGAAWRMAAANFQTELAASAALRATLHRYVYVLMSQTVTSAVCLRYHRIGPRLARWLLMTQDRAQADQFQMTHEFLALMLGVRRVGVTQAAGSLQSDGLIHYQRGAMSVVDRAGLEAAACSCYASDRAAYQHQLG